MSLPPQEITVKGKAARIRGATWTHDQVKKLFDVWTQPDIYQGLLNEKKKLDIFKNMASILSTLGVNRTWRECRAKIKNLKADFRKAMEKKTAFRYYEQMKKIMNLDGSATRTSGSGTGAGSSMTIDSFFAPTSTSSSQSQQHFQFEGAGLEVEDDSNRETLQRRPSASEEAIPSTSRSVIQRVPSPQYRQEIFYSQTGYQMGGSNEDSSSLPRYTPPPSTSSRHSHSPYSTTTSDHLPHTPQYQQEHYQEGQGHEDERRHGWRQSAEESEDFRFHHRESQSRQGSLADDNVVEHDSSSRSSMIITHVVSNVIEPVTPVVIPSSGGRVSQRVSEDLEIIEEHVMPDDKHEDTPPPLRLEFVLDEENVILTSPHSPLPEDVPPTTTAHIETVAVSTSPIPSPTTTPIADEPVQSPPQILRQRLKQQKRPATTSPTTPSPTSSPPKPTHPRRKPTTPPSSSSLPSTLKPGVAESKRRKLLETLNKKTVETISDLLTETSQNLLKELQDAEQRFILWEEEKRGEERKREEAMFTKLIAAMKSSHPPASTPRTSTDHNLSQEMLTEQAAEKETGSIISNFSSMSRRVNEMVCGEVKQTEECLRQWETKMQRQESRHTEKLFGMIINAIKTSSSHDGGD